MVEQFQGLVGLGAIVAVAVLLSEKRDAIPAWRWIAAAIGIQLALALLILNVPLVWDAIGVANSLVQAVEAATLKGAQYMFGFLGGSDAPFVLKEGAAPPVILAFQILPLVIVLSAISALLWHWGVLSAVTRFLGWALQKSMGVSGAVGLSGGANIFLGVVESPLVIRGYLGRMTRSDLFAAMVLAMSTVSGAILVLYASTLGDIVPNAIGHLITASLISLPAAILIAKILVPGEGTPISPDDRIDLKYESSVDAVVKGAQDGMQVLLWIIAIIITVFSLIYLADGMLAELPHVNGEAVTLRRIFGWVFTPVMWAIGIPFDQAGEAGAFMGTKAILNEYVAFLELSQLQDSPFDPRSLLILTYALCGFANLASIGLLISTIGALAPTRKSEVAALGFKSWMAGNMVTCMTGAIVGLVTWA